MFIASEALRPDLKEMVSRRELDNGRRATRDATYSPCQIPHPLQRVDVFRNLATVIYDTFNSSFRGGQRIGALWRCWGRGGTYQLSTARRAAFNFEDTRRLAIARLQYHGALTSYVPFFRRIPTWEMRRSTDSRPAVHLT